MAEKNMEQIVAHCKNTGFIFPGSEIYGGLANSWDYGPLGIELKNNIKKIWWEKVVATRNFNYSVIKELLPELKFLLENNNTN